MVSCTLLVKNLEAETSTDNLKDAFKRFGKINDVTFSDSSETTAQITFARVKSAKKAMTTLNGKEVCGSVVEITLKEDDDDDNEDVEEQDNVEDVSVMPEEVADEEMSVATNNETEKPVRTCHICSKEGHIAKFCPENPKKSLAKISCFKCGKFGHKSHACRLNQSGGSNKLCYNCAQEGHLLRDCPTKSAGDSRTVCFNCKQTGHISRECPNKTEDNSSNRNCYKCGQSGHMLKDCTNDAESDFKPKSCFKCGVVGHFSRECQQTGGPVRGRKTMKGNNGRTNKAPYKKRQNQKKSDNPASALAST